jgi:hypothetical protein
VVADQDELERKRHLKGFADLFSTKMHNRNYDHAFQTRRQARWGLLPVQNCGAVTGSENEYPTPLHPKKSAFTPAPRLNLYATKHVSRNVYISLSKLAPLEILVLCSKTAL